jgi:hypothetical protein
VKRAHDVYLARKRRATSRARHKQHHLETDRRNIMMNTEVQELARSIFTNLIGGMAAAKNNLPSASNIHQYAELAVIYAKAMEEQIKKG